MVERARSGQQGGGAGRGGALRRGGRRRRIHGNFLVFAISFNKARAPAQPFSRSKVNGSRQSGVRRLPPQRGHGPLPLGRRHRRITVEDRLSALRAFRLLLVALLIAASPARAAGDDTTRQTLNSARSTIADIETALKADNLSDSDLVRLRAAGDPLAVELQAVIVDLAPRLEASAKRLAELTPKSKEPAVDRFGEPRTRRREAEARRARRRLALGAGDAVADRRHRRAHRRAAARACSPARPSRDRRAC